MQQRQPRLGDILDDYCPRERRLTNHAVVAMIGEDIRLTRCTTCESEHDYKHARVPRIRKKSDAVAAMPAGFPVPRRLVPDVPAASDGVMPPEADPPALEAITTDDQPAELELPEIAADAASDLDGTLDGEAPPRVEEGPVHRQLIRAQLPRPEGQQPTSSRPAPDFTIRQPTGRQNRFRFRSPRNDSAAGGMFSQNGHSNRGNGNGNGNANGNVGGGRGNGPRPSGRPPLTSRPGNRQGGRKRSK